MKNNRRSFLQRAALTLASAGGLAAGVAGVARSQSPGTARGGGSADTILTNGKIIQANTPNPRNTGIAQAAAIRDGKFLAVGTNAEIEALAYSGTQRIDLRGRTVLPGLIDTHSHLQDYGIDHYGSQLVPQLTPIRVPGKTWAEVKSNTLSAIRQRATQVKAGEWIVLQLPFKFLEPSGKTISNIAAVFAPWGIIPGTKEPVVTRIEMDKVAPNNPVYVGAAASAIFNTRALDLIKAYFGQLEHPRLHLPTGASGVLLARSVLSDIIVPDLDTLAEILRRESNDWMGYGITTFSTSLQGIQVLKAYQRMYDRGQMPHRLAWGHGWGITANPRGPEFYRYYGIPDGYGHDYIWTVGVAGTNLDHIPPHVETSHKVEDGAVSAHTKAQEFSWLTDKSTGNLTEVLKAQLRAGHSLKGNHIQGDRTLDRYMDIIEEVAKEQGWTDEHVRSLRCAYDHSSMYPRPDQIPRMARLGIQASIGPKYIGNLDYVNYYGEKKVHEWLVPAKSLIDGGVLTAWEIDEGRIRDRPGNAFYYLEVLVTRNPDGKKVWGPQNRIDRMTALYTATRWAANYVLRENTLGSIEPGKLADLVVLERDYMTVPDNQIHTVNPQIVMVGGKIAHQKKSA